MVIHYPFFGGPHNQALRLNGPLEKRGFQTTVLLPEEPGNAAARLRANGIDVVTFSLQRLRVRPDPVLQARFVGHFVGDVRRIRQLIRERGVDVVEVNGLVNPHGAFAGRREGVAVVWQLLDTRAPMVLRRAMMPLVRRLGDVVMTTGVGVAEVHPGAMQLDGRLVPFFPPVDTSLFRPDGAGRAVARRTLGLPEDAFVAGCVANITPQKGLEYFVEAAKHVQAELPDARFIILGRRMETKESYEGTIRRIAARAGIEIHDPEDRVPVLLRALDVFALTAVPRSEGISTTVLEAMSTGIPVVTTDVGALREVVRNEITGFVVPPLDSKALGAGSLRLAHEPKGRRMMGLRARDIAVARFDAGICADTHVRAYEIAAQHAERRR